MPASGTLMLVAVVGFIAFLAGRYVFPKCREEPDPGDAPSGTGGSSGDGVSDGRRARQR